MDTAVIKDVEGCDRCPYAYEETVRRTMPPRYHLGRFGKPPRSIEELNERVNRIMKERDEMYRVHHERIRALRS